MSKTKKRRTQKPRKAVSDSRLMQLWRQAVLMHWHYTDPLSWYRDPTGESLQCHHYIRRKHFLLRWDYRNGVPLTAQSHEYAHTKGGDAELKELLDTDYLHAMERWTKKQYLLEHGLSENEFRLRVKQELEQIIITGDGDNAK
jgi:hypothetical protein